jgi:hypothetical protein
MAEGGKKPFVTATLVLPRLPSTNKSLNFDKSFMFTSQSWKGDHHNSGNSTPTSDMAVENGSGENADKWSRLSHLTLKSNSWSNLGR